MPKKVWTYSPQSGGQKIPPKVQSEVKQKLLAYAEERYGNVKDLIRIDVRFKGHFCYIDAYHEPPEPDEESLSYFGITREEFIEQRRNTPSPLCRLRYFQLAGWTLAIYTYSNEKYEPAIFSSGKWEGTPEEALDMVMKMYYPESVKG